MKTLARLGLTSLVFLCLFPHLGWSLTIRTEPAEPELSDKPITLKVKLASSGVEQGPTFPLGPKEGRVGETVEMGQLNSSEERHAQLLVMLPGGSYFRDITSKERRNGTVDLTVFPSGDKKGVTVKGHEVLVQPLPRGLMVRESLILNNPNDALVGGKNPIKLDLPVGVERIFPGPGMASRRDLKKEGSRYRYQHKIPPGETILGFFYMLKTKGSSYDFTRSITLPTRRFRVRLRDYENLSVTAKGLARQSGSNRNGKQSFLKFYGTGLKPEDRISLQFSGLTKITPMTSSTKKSRGGSGQPGSNDPLSRPSTFSGVSLPLLLGIGFSLVVFVGSYGYVQYRLARVSEPSTNEDFLDFVLRELARLDQEFNDGAIDEPYFRRTRRRWKQKAEELENDESSSV